MTRYNQANTPWTAKSENGGSYIFDHTILSAKEEEMAHCNKEEAALIAAAPELLEELTEALDTLEWLCSIHNNLNIDSDIARMKSLISKAKSKS